MISTEFKVLKFPLILIHNEITLSFPATLAIWIAGFFLFTAIFAC